MSGADFLDTNIFVYAYANDDPRKRSQAGQLMKAALAGKAVTSNQVLKEYAGVLLHKLSPRVPAEEVSRILIALSPIHVLPSDEQTILRAVEVHARYGVHFYDGLILAAAEQAGCKRVLSEDLNPGQTYFGVRVENPFA